MKLFSIEELEKTIMLYDKLQLECDGMTRVLSFVLSELEIAHMVCTGILTGPNGGIPHFWIQIENGNYIDLRCRMWQGDNSSIPHGIFNANDYPSVQYEISTQECWEVSNTIYTILTGETEILK